MGAQPPIPGRHAVTARLRWNKKGQQAGNAGDVLQEGPNQLAELEEDASDLYQTPLAG